MSSLSWPARLGLMLRQREPVVGADRFRLHKYGWPRLALAEHRVEELEEIVGALPTDFREFLTTADGWPYMLSDFCLFGREELLGGGLGEVAETRMRDFEIDLTVAKIDPLDLRPIGASPHDPVVFCLRREGGVLWLEDGKLVESFDSYIEFFESLAAMTDRLAEELARHTAELLREGHKLPD